MSFNYITKEKNNPANEGEKFEIPQDIQEIIDKSCFGCHNAESQSDKAKKKLQFDQLDGLSKSKLVGTLDEIVEVVEENEMPPEKFLEKYPDKKLTEEEAKKLKEWAEANAEERMK
jgi:mono/diheme cytochrome c family protein